MPNSPCHRIPRDWPNREASRCVEVGGIDWHVQVAGRGKPVLLLHGTGSSSHSWADVLPALTMRATVIAPDLPGHGYTTGGARADGLAHIAHAVFALVDALGLGAPQLVVGHSAGAAVALQCALAPWSDVPIVGFNPSLVPPPMLYQSLLAPIVTPIATSALAGAALSGLAARTSVVRSLLESTRSRIPAEQERRYAALFANPDHVRGTMRFMAATDLAELLRSAARYRGTLTLIAGSQDRWVPETSLRRIARQWLPAAHIERWDGGHVLHEEHPQRAAQRIAEAI
jgi:magnesium chelatase accessory protein